jgi:hypothetical protein
MPTTTLAALTPDETAPRSASGRRPRRPRVQRFLMQRAMLREMKHLAERRP